MSSCSANSAPTCATVWKARACRRSTIRTRLPGWRQIFQALRPFAQRRCRPPRGNWVAPKGPPAQLIATAAKEDRVSLLEPEAYAVCKQYDVRVPPFKLVETVQDAVNAANDIGYPVVLKVVSAQILHKSDIGGVMLGISSDGVLEQSYARLVENVRKAAPDIRNPSVLVQKMMPSTTELVLGAIRDKLFGPVVMFGLGGIYVEVLKRVGFRLAPFGIEQARELIADTLPPQLIAGARGRNKLNVDAIAETLVSLGRLLEEQPQIEQVDLNPCLALDDCCMAVDARIILSKQ